MRADGDWQDLNVLSIKLNSEVHDRPPVVEADSSSADPLPVVPDWVEFPWLLQEHWPQLEADGSGGQPARGEARQARVAQSGRQGLNQDRDLFDMDPDEVWAELGAQRAKWRGPVEGCEHFKLNLRGGMWTAEHKGVAVDTTRSAAQSNLAVTFCDIYTQHKSASFSHAAYTEHFAWKLAEVWSHRMSFWLELWIERGMFRTERFHVSDAGLYEKPGCVTELMENGDESVVRRLQQVLATSPRLHS